MEITSTDLSFIRGFLLSHRFSVVATVTAEGDPECAKVEYFLLEGGLDLVFRTQRDSRKYQNIIHHPTVALEIGDLDTDTVQYEGVAEEFLGVFSKRDSVAIASRSRKSRVIYDEDDIVYFVVRPTWVRYTNVATRPWKQLEINF